MSEEVITTNVISATIDIVPSESTLEGGGTVVSTTIDIIPSGDVPEAIAEGDNIISVQIDILPEIHDESSESSSGNSGNSGEPDSSSSSSDSGYAREDGLEYVRLDDDVSFQILRTNPKLTTNTKLMYDGENLYMEAYPAAPILSTLEYQHHRVWKTGLFNRDIRNFLLGSNDAAFEVGHAVKDTVMMDNFDNQFETMYWCGVESINSDRYPQEMGCIAPLYLRKKRPNYFVIFKITNPSNYNMTTGDRTYNFVQDIMGKAKVVKAFDLREGTVLGDYIKRYVEQRDFKYDQSIYVNFSSHEIYYYGIDRKLGVLTQKVENIEDQLLDNDNTIMKADDWITEGFERNNLIFPYIINLEFLFDDKDIDEFCFARYFGMYVNDIDLHDLEVSDCIYSEKYYNTTVTTTNSAENNLITSSDCFYYIKDKKGEIHSVKSTTIPGFFQCPGKLNKDDFTGFESTSTAAYVERIDGVGRAMTIFEIIDDLSQDDTLKIESTVTDVSTQLGRFIADTGLEAGTYYQNRFSCQGTTVDQAKALAAVINACNTDSLQWVGAFSIDDKVVIRSYYPGSHMNRLFKICFPNASSIQRKIRFVSEELKSLETNEIRESYIDGGTDINGCMFKVLTSDRNMFFDESETDRDPVRYFKCGYGRKNAKIISIVPYVTDDNKIDDTYSIVITDENGPFVNVSKTDQAEIIDKFYPKIGVLSMFPVRDFDFDTVTSAYGDYSLMQKEIEDFDTREVKLSEKMPYGRFFYHNDVKIDNEYSYYVENVIPELTAINKTVPFIAKWGYMDGGKDSCENPYRLNTSKIFEACNFSANTFMQNGDIMEYTHSMPYYINPKVLSKNDYNEYQYIEKDSNTVWSGTYDDLVSYFSNKNEDNFDKVFGDTSLTSKYKNKRANKKYSRFLLGNDIHKSTTLFRGVKFEITELDKGKEVNTGKYNDYRFSVIFFPVRDRSDVNTPIRFIKNDTFKFIVGVIIFDKENDDYDVFNKAYVYAKNEDLIGVNENEGIQDEESTPGT